MRIKFISSFLFALSVAFISFVPITAHANPLNYIISDKDLTDPNAMSLSWMRTFLRNKGALGRMTFTVNNTNLSAAEIIRNVALDYRISPKYLITRMQIEQGLISASNPTQYQLDWATGYGRCDNCTPESAAKYQGFSNQVLWGAKGIRERYLTDLEAGRTTISGWKPGKTKKTLDGLAVTPENNATAVLYTYTPWAGKLFGGDPNVGGNGLFHKIFTEWFGTTYTDGTLLQDTQSGGIYLIRDGKKLPFLSRAAFYANYDIRKIIQVPPSILDSYEIGSTIKYPNFTLLRSPKGTVYLYQDGTIRGIQSPEVLRNLGFNPEEIIEASWSDLKGLVEKTPITLADIYPAGALLQYKETGGIVYIDPQGVRHSVISKEILESRFHGRSIITKTASEINQYPAGDKILFRDGELVSSRDTGTVYVIANGQKRPFVSGEAFTNLGYKWNNIVYTSKATLDIHPNGAPIKLEQ